MEFVTYVRKPFEVQVVEITRENIEEVARFVGDVRYRDDQTPYILVDRRLVPSVDRVHIGFFMTKIGDNVRCYSPRVFREQFVEKTPEIQPWLDFLAGKEPQKDAAPAGA